MRQKGPLRARVCLDETALSPSRTGDTLASMCLHSALRVGSLRVRAPRASKPEPVGEAVSFPTVKTGKVTPSPTAPAAPDCVAGQEFLATRLRGATFRKRAARPQGLKEFAPRAAELSQRRRRQPVFGRGLVRRPPERLRPGELRRPAWPREAEQKFFLCRAAA
jgi:hypothetical protein